MSHARFAIGQAGQPPRLIVTDQPDNAAANARAGEVCIDATTLPAGPVLIAADGKSLVSGAATLAELRRARWIEAKNYRAARKAAGCAAPKGGRVQTDAASRIAIDDAATQAAANRLAVPAWTIAWTMADNSVVTHTADEMIALASAVRAHGLTCHAVSQPIRKAIDAAATPAAVAAVDITAGYPA